MTVMASSETGTNPLLRVAGLGKGFPGIRALDDVGFSAPAGHVLGLVGENGAGKSTLIKILSGVYPDYDGEFAVAGEPAAFASPRDAQNAGIATIFQELTLVPDMSVAENVFLGREIVRPGPFGRIDRAEMRRRTLDAADRLQVALDPDQPVAQLSIATRQLVEICKALVLDARIVIMDEPTSSLSHQEVEKLFDVIRMMRRNGALVIYVSHRLDEVFEVCDQVLVMRDGCPVLDAPVSGLGPDDVVRAMVGRSLDQVFPERAQDRGDAVLSLRNFSRAGEFVDVSFDLHKGEILGLAGLVGAGRTELGKAIVGATRADRGTVQVAGRAPRIYGHPRDALEDGIVYLSEDRKGDGLMLEHSLRENIALSVLPRLASGGLLRRGRETALAHRQIEALQIKADGPEAAAQSLSGGNQQKVALARLLATEAAVFILDEPTRGVDIGAKSEIYRIVRDLAAAGRAVLLISSELPEILGLADRIALMSDGRIVEILDHAGTDAEQIMARLAGHEAA